MNARVNFLSEKVAGQSSSVSRVLVPKAAVVKQGSNTFVFVVKGDKVEQRTIRTGDESGETFHVLDGLSGNETVAVTGADKLSDGDRVKIQ